MRRLCHLFPPYILFFVCICSFLGVSLCVLRIWNYFFPINVEWSSQYMLPSLSSSGITMMKVFVDIVERLTTYLKMLSCVWSFVWYNLSLACGCFWPFSERYFWKKCSSTLTYTSSVIWHFKYLKFGVRPNLSALFHRTGWLIASVIPKFPKIFSWTFL